MKPIRILAMFAAVCLLASPMATLAGSGVAQAAPAAASAPISWLAAGDSYSSGEGLPHSKGKCAQAAPGSGSSTWAYQAYLDLKASQPDIEAPNLVACTAAVTSDLIDANDGEGHPEWSPSMGTFDLVTFTFGGDNVGFAPFLEQCIGLSRLVSTSEYIGTLGERNVEPLPSDPGHTCPADSIMRQRIKALGVSYRKFLTEVANRVVARGGNIIVLGYPEFVELPKYWNWWERQIGACWGIGTGDATEIRGLAGDLNATIAQAVTAINAQAPRGVHVRYVDVNTGNPAQGIPYSDAHLFEPSAGPRHNLCAGQEWLNGWTHIGRGKGSFHPNQHGLDNEGALVAKVIGDLDWSHLVNLGVNPHPVLGQPSAVALPGKEISSDNAAVLVSPGPNNADFGVYLTTADVSHALELASALPGRTIDTYTGSPVESAVLADPGPGHPDGTTIVAVEANTPAQGLTPSHDDTYLLVYDNASGTLDSAVRIGGGNLTQLVYGGHGTATLLGSAAYRINTATGAVESTSPYSGTLVDSGYGMFLTTSTTRCESYVYSAITLKLLSTVPTCSSNNSESFLSASSLEVDDVSVYSTATGRAIFNNGGGADMTITTGPRSTLAVSSDTSNQTAPTVYDVSSWAPIYTIPNSQSLSISVWGIADDDIWVTTTSQNLVISGRSGAVLATDWSVIPIDGGNGWTVFVDYPPTNGITPEYLVRSTEPAVEAMAALPPTSGSGRL